MRFLVLLSLGWLLFTTGVHAQSVVADGKVFYQLPAGEIVYRGVSLEVPARGQGDVVLRGENSEEAVVADRFFSVESAGRVVFYVVFRDPPGSQPGTLGIWRGTYLRGSNQATYYGEVFTKPDPGTLPTVADAENGLIVDDEATYAAGFWFVAPIGS